MAKYNHNHLYSKKGFLGLLVLLFGLSIGLVAMAKTTEFSRTKAALPPVPVVPCSGNWNNTDCFKITNTQKISVRFAYAIDCYDTDYCQDVSNIVTLKPGQTIVLGQPSPCAGWQLDLNWSSPDTAAAKGSWQWGAVVNKSSTAVCHCNYTELNIQPSI